MSNTSFSDLCLIVILLASAAPALALAKDGADSSGGGLTVSCFDDPSIPEMLRKGDGILSDSLLPHVTSLQNFDLYEAGLSRGLLHKHRQNVIAIKDGEKGETYAERILKRLDYAVPELSRMFRRTRAELESRPIAYVREPLEKMNDARQIGLIDYENCMLATMGLNRLESGAASLKVDDRLYLNPLHSEQSKGVFLLHEYVYVTARRLGQNDSRHTRTLINLLITENPELTVNNLIIKAREFGFSGEGRLPSYANELIRPMVREILAAGREAYMKTVPEALALIEKTDKAIRPYGLTCAGTHITPCMSSVWGLNLQHKLQELGDELTEFSKRRTDAVQKAMLKVYDANLVMKAPGLSRGAAELTDRHVREDVINQIAIQMSDAGLMMPGAKPLDEVDLEEIGMRFAREVELEVDYPVEVVR
jgi:hypothetical protein